MTLTELSNSQTFMHLLRTVSGVGFLSLPFAFKNVGLWVGLAVFLFVALVAVHCMLVVCSCCELLESRFNTRVLTYVDALKMSLLCGPKIVKNYADLTKHIVGVLVILLNCGYCSVLLVWSSVNLKQVGDNYWPANPSVRHYEAAIFLIVLLPYAMITSLRVLAFFSGFANLVHLVGLVIIFQFILQDVASVEKRQAFKSFDAIPFLMGVIMFIFETLCVIVPVRSKMKNVQDFGGWNGLLSLAMVLAVAVYTAFGFFGYLMFGEETASVITFNLPKNNWLYNSLTLIFAVAMLFTIGVFFYVPVTLILPAVKKRLPPDQSKIKTALVSVGSRGAIMTFIFAVAVSVPHLDLLMTLYGSCFGGFLSLIIPAIIEILVMKNEEKLTTVMLMKDVLIILFGLLVAVVGTYVSVRDIILFSFQT